MLFWWSCRGGKHVSRIAISAILREAFRCATYLSDSSKRKLKHDWSLVQTIFFWVSRNPLSISPSLLIIKPWKWVSIVAPRLLHTVVLRETPMIDRSRTCASSTSFFHVGNFFDIFGKQWKCFLWAPKNTNMSRFVDTKDRLKSELDVGKIKNNVCVCLTANLV